MFGRWPMNAEAERTEKPIGSGHVRSPVRGGTALKQAEARADGPGTLDRCGRSGVAWVVTMRLRCVRPQVSCVRAANRPWKKRGRESCRELPSTTTPSPRYRLTL